jgi:hypothetical protein
MNDKSSPETHLHLHVQPTENLTVEKLYYFMTTIINTELDKTKRLYVHVQRNASGGGQPAQIVCS